MKKRIIVVIIATTIMLSISIVTAIKNEREKEESPLYNIRANKAIQQKIQNIQTKYFGDRLFYLPFILHKSDSDNYLRDQLNNKDTSNDFTCQGTCFIKHTCGSSTECRGTCSGITCKETQCAMTCPTKHAFCTWNNCLNKYNNLLD